MFHTYVRASSGRQIDFDRARLLMDDDLFHAAHREVIAMHATPFDRAVADRMGSSQSSRLRSVWCNYCQRHREKYGEDFLPDVSMTWDT